MKRIENKVIIVTGDAFGIGRESCLLLAKKNTKVTVTDVLYKEGQDLIEEISQE